MSTTVVDEFVKRASILTAEERKDLVRRLSEPKPQPEAKKNGKNRKKGYVSPNTIWIKENKSKYAGNYVALKDGKLIAFGKTIKEADQAARAKGVNDPLLHYILAEGEKARLTEPDSPPKIKKNGKKGYLSPNTIWLRDHGHEYPGMHVAIKDGEFVAAGRTIKDADLAAKEKGVERPLLAYISGEDEEVWGGW